MPSVKSQQDSPPTLAALGHIHAAVPGAAHLHQAVAAVHLPVVLPRQRRCLALHPAGTQSSGAAVLRALHCTAPSQYLLSLRPCQASSCRAYTVHSNEFSSQG